MPMAALWKIFSTEPHSLTGSTQRILAGGGNWDPVYLGWTPQRLGYRALASALAQSTASNTWFGGVPEVYASNLCLCQYLTCIYWREIFTPPAKWPMTQKRLTTTSTGWVKQKKIKKWRTALSYSPHFLDSAAQCAFLFSIFSIAMFHGSPVCCVSKICITWDVVWYSAQLFCRVVCLFEIFISEIRHFKRLRGTLKNFFLS